jgi:predicted lactoylglutathione lyase
MASDVWLNLPVKDVKRSAELFISSGLAQRTEHGNSETSQGLVFGEKKFVVMLFHEPIFKNIVAGNVSDAKQANEMMISIGASSKNEVDELAKKIETGGGTIFSKPQEVQGWMYGFAFSDLDGHKWNILYMDMGKMPK